MAGLSAAREEGRSGGRPKKMTPENVAYARRLLENGATRQQVADVIGVSLTSIYRHVPIERKS
ncbi:helix-turn-helix domain-containing protein [Jejubacter calystegiae]|uniref:helix-turn-helix domain-containing protein n=1 Tax=Jejubacter calystegiae TaxID=2579935 RepID=UPI003BAC8031